MWKCSATKRHDDGCIRRSIDINKRRFQLDTQLVCIFQNTIEAIETIQKNNDANGLDTIVRRCHVVVDAASADMAIYVDGNLRQAERDIYPGDVSRECPSFLVHLETLEIELPCGEEFPKAVAEMLNFVVAE